MIAATRADLSVDPDGEAVAWRIARQHAMKHEVRYEHDASIKSWLYRHRLLQQRKELKLTAVAFFPVRVEID